MLACILNLFGGWKTTIELFKHALRIQYVHFYTHLSIKFTLWLAICQCNVWRKWKEIKGLARTHIQSGWMAFCACIANGVIKILRRIIMFIAACMHACPQIYVFFPVICLLGIHRFCHWTRWFIDSEQKRSYSRLLKRRLANIRIPKYQTNGRFFRRRFALFFPIQFSFISLSLTPLLSSVSFEYQYELGHQWKKNDDR